MYNAFIRIWDVVRKMKGVSKKVLGIGMAAVLVLCIFFVLVPPATAVYLHPGTISNTSPTNGDTITFSDVNITIEGAERIPITYINFTIFDSNDNPFQNVSFTADGTELTDSSNKFSVSLTSTIGSDWLQYGYGYGYQDPSGPGVNFSYGYGYGYLDSSYSDITFLYNISYTTNSVGTYYAKLFVNCTSTSREYTYHSSSSDTFTVSSGSSPRPPQPPIPIPPVADAGGPYSSLEDSIVTFDGSGSYDPDGSITNYTWLLDGSVLLYGETAKYLFSQPGNYTLSLTVTDTDGLTDTNSTTVRINALPPDVHRPIPIINGPYRAIINDTITFDGSKSYDPNDGTIKNYTWYLGDGTIKYGAIVTHSYTTKGNYTITLFIEDLVNLTNSTSSYADIYQGTPVKPLDGDLIDTNDSGTYDYYYNKTSGVITKTQELQNGSYLIDDTGDGKWNWIYDPVTGNLSKYHEAPTPSDEFPWIAIIIIIVVVIAILIAVLVKKKIIYFDDSPKNPKQ